MAAAEEPSAVDVEVHESWSCTDLRIVKFHHIWTIHNFRSHGEQKAFRSARFSSGNDDGLGWNLELRTDSTCGSDEEYISIFLRMNSCKQPQVRVECRFSLLEAGNKIIGLSRTLKPFDFREGWGFADMIERDELIAYMDEQGLQDLAVSCEISAAVAILETSSLKPKETSCRDLESLDPSTACGSAGSRMFLDGVHNPSTAYSTSCDEEIDDFFAEVEPYLGANEEDHD